MKRLIFSLILIPQVLFAQEEGKTFEGFEVKNCYQYVAKELCKTDGIFNSLTKNSISEATKTIYINKQGFLVELPETANGIAIKQIDVAENMKTLAKEVKSGEAAIFHVTEMVLRPDTCDIWVFPMEVKKSMFKTEVSYSEQGCKAKFFFNQAPPKFIFRNVDCAKL